jgi:Vacuolar-sorting-associated 13 protein C-terminal
LLHCYQQSIKVKNLPGLIAAILPSVSEAPIRLPGKGITFIFENRSEIFNSLSNYYINEILKQFYKIIGSIDFVGNPTMLLNSFATGVRDFFVAPSKEFFRSPKNPSRLGLGVAKGTLSLVSHSASGLFGFAAKMSATAAQTAAIFSFDHEYQEWHREHILAEAKNLDRHWKRRGAGGISRIFTRPIVDLVRGTILGTAGLITKPINSARKDGPRGIISGFALGTAGVVIKPFVGILDAFSHFAGSIHDVAKSVNVLDKRYRQAKRLRLPHVFSIRHILIPYDAVASQSLQLLKKFPFVKKNLFHQEIDGQRIKEVHIASAVLCTDSGIETYIIVSNVRVALVKIKSLGPYHRNEILCWEIPLMGVSNLTSQISEIGHDGTALTISVNFINKNLNHVIGNQFPFPKMRNLQELERGQVFSRKSRVDGSTMIPGSEQFDNLNSLSDMKKGKENVNFFPSGYDDAMHNDDDDSSNDSTDVFSVIADFHNRQKLMRIHNAICCLSQKMDELVFDQRQITDLGTNGYTSFGELHFTEQKSVKRDSWCDGIEALENVPWVPCFFFDSIRNNDRLNAEDDFHLLRLRWNLGEELHASKLIGGPEWLVNARAVAEFLPECTPLYEEHEPEEDKMLQGHEHFTSLYHQDSKRNWTDVENMDNPVFAHSEKKVSPDLDANFRMHSDKSMPFPPNFIKAMESYTNESGKDVFSPQVKESQYDNKEGELLLPSIIQHVGTEIKGNNSESTLHESPKDACQRLEKLEKMLETIVEVTFNNVNNKIERHSNLDVEVAKLREEVQVLQAALVNQRRHDDENIERLMKVIESIQNDVNSHNIFGDSSLEVGNSPQPKKYVRETSKKKNSEYVYAYKAKFRDQQNNLPSKKVIRPGLLNRLRKKEPVNESVGIPSSYVEEVFDDSAEESLEDRPDDFLLDDDISGE